MYVDVTNGDVVQGTHTHIHTYTVNAKDNTQQQRIKNGSMQPLFVLLPFSASDPHLRPWPAARFKDERLLVAAEKRLPVAAVDNL